MEFDWRVIVALVLTTRRRSWAPRTTSAKRIQAVAERLDNGRPPTSESQYLFARYRLYKLPFIPHC